MSASKNYTYTKELDQLNNSMNATNQKDKIIPARYWKVELVAKDVILPPLNKSFHLSIYLIGPPPKRPSNLLLFQMYYNII